MGQNGGRRPGAGRPKGARSQSTIEKEAWNERIRARIAARADDFFEAQAQLALGVVHLLAKDKDGQFVQVTDPEVMVRVLNSGETFYRLAARNPDGNVLRDLFNRLCGVPAPQKQQVEVSGSLSLKEIIVASATSSPVTKSSGD